MATLNNSTIVFGLNETAVHPKVMIRCSDSGPRTASVGIQGRKPEIGETLEMNAHQWKVTSVGEMYLSENSLWPIVTTKVETWPVELIQI